MESRDKALVSLGFAVAAAAALGVPSGALAQAAAASDAWRFEVTPYVLGASLKGTTGINNVTADVDMPFSEIVKNLDSGFMMLFEAGRGRWSYGFEGVYFKLKEEGTRSWQGPGGIGSATGNLETAMSEQIYQVSVGHRVLDERTKLDLIGAVRYTRLDSDLDLVVTTGPLLPGGARSLSERADWWDPVLGVRVLVPFADHWSFLGYGDVGGFGVGSDVTYQAIAGVAWEFAKGFKAKAGYRYLYQDYKDDKGFIWDMAAHGFYIGMGFAF